MGNPWLERRVLNWAHQGGAREGPSSTLHAMRRAVAAGADALELDVHMTADGHLVVCHDATIDRTTNGTGAIAVLTLDELRALDNAYWWVPGEIVKHDAAHDEYVHRGEAPDDPEFQIPTVAQVLDAFPDVFLNFDIKQTAPVVEPYEERLAQLLLDRGRVDGVIVASFNDGSTDAFALHAPDIATSMGTLGTAEFYRAVQAGEAPPETRHVALQVPPSYESTTIVDERFVDAAHENGLAVHVWTIDEAGEMERLIGLGVDAVMTDRPTVLEEVVQQLGVAYG